jgi:hypothetical protein
VPAADPGRSDRADAPWRRRVPRMRPSAAQQAATGVPAWVQAVPADCAPARSQQAWRALARQVVEDAQLRSDAEEGLYKLVDLLARWAEFTAPMTTRPTWAVLLAGTERKRSWLADRLRWLRERGLLATVETGSTPLTRPAALAGLAGNRAATYLLVQPLPRLVGDAGTAVEAGGEPAPEAAAEIADSVPVEETRTLPVSWSLSCPSQKTPNAREEKSDGSVRLTGDKPAPKASRRPVPRPGTRRRRRRDVAAALQQRALAARRLSVEHVAALVRVFVVAGWSMEDLAYALDYAPDGSAHWHSAPVRSPAGWLASRLAWWTDAAGTVRPGRSAQLAAAAAAHRAAQGEQRAAAAAAAVAPPERRREHLAAIRAELAERRRRCAG